MSKPMRIQYEIRIRRRGRSRNRIDQMNCASNHVAQQPDTAPRKQQTEEAANIEPPTGAAENIRSCTGQYIAFMRYH